MVAEKKQRKTLGATLLHCCTLYIKCVCVFYVNVRVCHIALNVRLI